MLVAITTFDNPYDPIEQFRDWYRTDLDFGYNTCSYLSRVVDKIEDQLKRNNSFESFDENEILEKAIDEIIANDFRNIYKKVKVSEDSLEKGTS